MLFNDREPIYLQIIRTFKRKIVNGDYKPGEPIPSRRELATLWKVNANTVQRAYKEMEESGVIQTDRNVPSVITLNKTVLDGIREELIREAVSQFVESLAHIAVPKNEALQLVEKYYDVGEFGC
ncbi:MAG: GntR family transcriptional regulator [Bacilli bacterium]